MKRYWLPSVLSVAIAAIGYAAGVPRTSGISSTPHNLSVSGPGDVRSMTETEVCKFCHVPHSAVQADPLWGHSLSDVQSYTTANLRRKGGRIESAPQPTGSSRLCLSCHDGTVALGEIGTGRVQIPMAGTARLTPGDRGFIGTDLSGSHPISVPMPDAADLDDESDMGMRPAAVIASEGVAPLDEQGLMQCTSCHDPHSDQYFEAGRTPHFWVRPTVNEVCVACHELR